MGEIIKKEKRGKLLSKGKLVCNTAKKAMTYALFPMLALVVFSLIAAETYPFSNFSDVFQYAGFDGLLCFAGW